MTINSAAAYAQSSASIRYLPLSLLLLRLGIGVVMAMWTIDKIINPQHAQAVFTNFYGVSGLENGGFLVIGLLQGLVVLAFIAGAFRTISYGLVSLMHAVSTFSSYRQLPGWF